MNLTYIQKQISRIPQYGDDCLWRIASNADLFDDTLATDGSLTPEQRATVLEFIDNLPTEEEWYLNQKSSLPADEPEPECINCDQLGFPECQYAVAGLDLGTAIKLSESWRRGEYLPAVGHPAGDRVSDKLNQMTNQPIALRK
jgi:hypothetical protein